MVGEGKVGRIECIACGEYFWYNTTGHQKQHPPDLPRDYYQYKEYVGEVFDLGEEHELLADDTVINPDKWCDVRGDYPDIEIGLELKRTADLETP